MGVGVADHAGASSADAEPDTAQHALHYLFRALAGELRATLINSIGEAAGSDLEGWPRRALGGLVQDRGSRCAAIVRDTDAGEVLEFGGWPPKLQIEGVGRAIRMLQSTAEADEEQSVRATYASLFRKLHPEMLRLERIGASADNYAQATAAYAELKAAWATELATGDAAARRQQTYTELEKELEEAEMKLAVATARRYKLHKTNDALATLADASAARAAMSAEIRASASASC